MKKWSMRIASTVFVIFLFREAVGDLISSDPIHYFAERKSRLLLVVLISLSGGLAAFVFDRMSLAARRRVKLTVVGLAAFFATAFTGWCLFESVVLLSQIFQSTSLPSGFLGWGSLRAFSTMLLGPLTAAIFLWIIFYCLFKRKTEELPQSFNGNAEERINV